MTHSRSRLNVLIALRTRREEHAMAALAAATQRSSEAQEAAANARKQHHAHCVDQHQQEAQLMATLAHGAFGHREVQQVDEALKALTGRRMDLEDELRRLDEQHAMALLRRSEALQTRNQCWKARQAVSLLLASEDKNVRLAEEMQADIETEDRPQARKTP